MTTMQNIVKGSLYIVGGIVLLLHTLDIMREMLNYVLIAASIIMIIYGLLKAGFIEKITQMVQRSKKESPK